MKRVLFATSLCLCALLFAGSLFAGEPSKEGSGSGSTKEKLPTALEDLLAGDTPIERSLIPTAVAWLDYSIETIELEFHKPVGNVVVTVTDAQGTIVTTLRASSAAPILLPMPGVGSYKITVEGEKYLGVCTFVID